MKTFSARTMPEALALVRKQFGTDAVVLHTRTYRRGGVLGMGAKPVVEITAMSGQQLARARQKTKPKSKSPPRSARLNVAPGPTALPTPNQPPSASPEPLAGELIRRTYAAARAESTPSGPAVASNVALSAPPAAAIDQQRQLTREIEAVKALVSRVAEQQDRQLARSETPDDVPDDLVEAYTALIQQEVADELARKIVDKARATDDPRASVRDALAQLLPKDESGSVAAIDAPTRDGDRPRTIALVGPTGVGKTTTVAKLAATFKLKQGRSVGVITLDTYRIAAVDQLRTYCSIIGCPLEVARNPQELRACLDHLADRDVVLIDTAGRSQRDDARLDDLAGFLRVADPHETHLVLASTCSQAVMLEIAERFARVNPDRVIFTKLDEAVTCGTIFNVAAKIAKRVSYVTTGQEVPHQIEPGDPHELAQRLLDNAAWRHRDGARETQRTPEPS